MTGEGVESGVANVRVGGVRTAGVGCERWVGGWVGAVAGMGLGVGFGWWVGVWVGEGDEGPGVWVWVGVEQVVVAACVVAERGGVLCGGAWVCMGVVGGVVVAGGRGASCGAT